MRALLACLALVALSADAGRFDRFNKRCSGGRSDRGLSCDDYAFLEFAPASGAGMGAVCACTTPTGARGEALTFTRGSSATCTKTTTGGLATTGIANGDLVTCSSNQPRVEYDSAGVLGLLVESARTNVLLRSDALTNAAWADVGTPNATDGAADPFGTSTGDTLTDNAAGAFEGRSQAVTVSAATAYIMSCYLKGTTSAKARLSLDGTTCDTSTLSSTTWSLVTCADASSSGVSISAQVLVGNAVGDTGDVVVGGCQVEAGTYATSYMATGAASANRLAEVAYLTLPSAPKQTGLYSAAATMTMNAPSSRNWQAWLLSNNGANPFSALYNAASVNLNCQSSDGAAITATRAAAGNLSGTRVVCFNDGSNEQGLYVGVAFATPAAGTKAAATATRFMIGGDSSAGFEIEGVISSVCVDPSPSRCR